MYRPALVLFLATMSSPHTSPVRPPSIEIPPAAKIVGTNDNLEQIVDTVLSTWNGGRQDYARKYMMEIELWAGDPVACRSLLVNIVKLSETSTGGIVFKDGKVIAKYPSHAQSIRVSDHQAFETYNYCSQARVLPSGPQ